MQLQDTFDVVSLEGTIERPVWLVQDFDEASRYWHIKHGPQWEQGQVQACDAPVLPWN
jgi:hypothetical protein